MKRILILFFSIYLLTISNGGFSQVWNGVGTGVDSHVYTMAVDSVNNELYFGGWFLTAGGILSPHIAKWDGTSISGVGAGMNNNQSTSVRSLCFFNGELYAGGSFDSAGTVQVNNIAKWDGTTWSPVGAGLNKVVYCLTVYNGELYAGGDFDSSGITVVHHLAKWNGFSWTDVGGGMNNKVFTLCQFGNELYAGGGFASAGNITTNHVAKWNGIVWDSVGIGFNSTVFKLYVHNSELYASGDFTAFPGNLSNYISKLSVNVWITLPSFPISVNTTIRSMATYNGELYITGLFSPPNYIAKFDGVTYSGLGTGLSYGGGCLIVYKNELYVGGYFNSVGGVPNTLCFARWSDAVGEFEPIATNEIIIAPNPFDQQTIFTFPDSYLEKESFTILIFDETGRTIQHHTLKNTNKYLLERNKMVSGIYFYKIIGKTNEIIARGKLVVN